MYKKFSQKSLFLFILSLVFPFCNYSFSCEFIGKKEKDEAKASPFKKFLKKRKRLSSAVFAHIDCDSNSNDNAFDYLLPHRADTDELKAILNNGEDQNAGDNAADFTDAAV